MRRITKFLSVSVALIILSLACCLPVFAAQENQDGIEAKIITDKDAYTADENIKTSITVKNTNDYQISDISVKAKLPEGLTLVNGSTTKTQETLKENETLTLEFTSKLNSQKKVTGTNPPSTRKPTDTATNDVVINDNNDNTTPKTGENTFYVIIFCALLVAAFAIIFASNNRNKDIKKKAKNILSLTLCLTVIASSVVGLNVFAARAAETDTYTNSFEISKTVKVDSREYKISATVAFGVKDEVTDSTDAENNDIQLTVDQEDFTTTESLQTITGSYKSTSEVKNIEYAVEVMKYASDGNYMEVDKTGNANINNNEWSIEDLRLLPDCNKITITLNAVDGKSVSKVINITYDSGYEYEYTDSEVEYDSSEDIYYINDIILVTFENDIPENRKTEIVNSIGGEVVGRENTIDYFQVKVDKASSVNELEELCDKAMSFPEVSEAEVETIFETCMSSQTYIPSDTWVGAQGWDEANPSGSNWWCEAIKLPSAWTYNDRFSRIKIGIADSGFAVDHEDLKVYFPNLTEEKRNKATRDHGSHVAGIIGATANNNKGITGIVWDKELICYDEYHSFNFDDFTYSFFTGGSNKIIVSIAKLVESGAKVINYSLGLNLGLIQDKDKAINRTAHDCSKVMSKLLSKGYDFLMVQAAGNDAVLSERAGYFSSINKDNCYYEKGSPSYEEIKSRIIVVANAEVVNNEYRLYEDSNYGSNVDIAAPGTHIYSTYADGYGYMGGTSMAAPMVTGVASLVWSVNPHFTGDEVKEIVCNSVDTPVSSNPDNASDNLTYNMLNAKLSVETAIVKTDGSLYNCFVKFVDSDTELTIPAKCTIYTATDEYPQTFEKYRYIGYSETFNIQLPEGVYRIDVTPLDEGHEATSLLFGQSGSGVNSLTIHIDKKVIKPQDSDFIYRIENDQVIITGYRGSGRKIIIPSHIEDKPVVMIDEKAFYKNTSIISVTFESSIDKIGVSAFDSCSGLTSVNIQGSVTDIEDYAFYTCKQLTSFTATDGVYNIGGMSFSGCKKLSDFGIQSKIQSIGGYAFFSCSSLYDFEYPKGAYVNRYAFMGSNTQYKNDWIKF